MTDPPPADRRRLKRGRSALVPFTELLVACYDDAGACGHAETLGHWHDDGSVLHEVTRVSQVRPGCPACGGPMWLELRRHEDLDELVGHHHPDLVPLWRAMVEAGHEPGEAVELAALCARAPGAGADRHR